jgi:tetratricopeptide (TPR) repeat protein
MKRQSLVSQGSLQRLVFSAHDAWRRCDFQKAIETMERASRLSPSNAEIFFQLGRMHGLRQNYPAAERSFEQAIRIAPRKTAAIAMAGTHSKEFLNSELNESYLRRAAEQTDAFPEIWVDLAAACERKRRLGEATALCERALKINARCGAALLVRARLERQAGNLETAEQLLRSLPADSTLNVRVRTGYELGTVLDRQGRYDEAMSELKKAKAQLITESQRHLAELKIVRASFHSMMEMISADLVQEWFAAGQELLQPPRRLVLLGGHPRSGTTLLEQVLDVHPDIVSAEETEFFYNEAYGPLIYGQPSKLPLFDGLVKATTKQICQLRENYFKGIELSLGQPVGSRLLVDKNPSYTFYIPAMARIFPEIKFLIALRDPRDVVLSSFMQPILPLNQTASAFLSLEGSVSEYASLMNIWLKMRPLLKNSWLEVRYEDMVDDLASVARKTLEFLGVPWDDRVLGFDEHARQKTVRSPTYADVTQPVYKRAMGRWRNYQKYLEPHLEKLEPFVKAFGYE